MEIITGYVGSAHVTSEQEGACQAAIYGAGKYVLNSGKKFSYEVINNNKIRIKDGYAINQGRLFGTCNGDYDEVTIDNGAQGMKRRDLIAIHYTMDSASGIEAAELAVIKGTPGSDYSTPSYVTGDIVGGATEDYFPLYQVNVNGLAIESVNAVFSVKQSMEGIVSDITSLNSSLCKLRGLNGKIDYKANSNANTITETCNFYGNGTNYPSESYYIMQVINGGTHIRQIAYDLFSDTVYVRRSTDSGATWSSWQRLATSEDLAPTTAIADCDTNTSAFAKANGSTLHTPYKESITQSQEFIIYDVKPPYTTWKTQIAISLGNSEMFIRSVAQSGWTSWKRLATSEDVPSGYFRWTSTTESVGVEENKLIKSIHLTKGKWIINVGGQLNLTSMTTSDRVQFFIQSGTKYDGWLCSNFPPNPYSCIACSAIYNVTEETDIDIKCLSTKSTSFVRVSVSAIKLGS